MQVLLNLQCSLAWRTCLPWLEIMFSCWWSAIALRRTLLCTRLSRQFAIKGYRPLALTELARKTEHLHWRHEALGMKPFVVVGSQ